MTASDVSRSSAKSALSYALSQMRKAFGGIALISSVINILALTGAIFMLQVYDRVLPGRSMPTLLALCAMAAMLFTFQGVLELIRSRLLIRLGVALDKRMAGSVLRIVMQLPLRVRTAGDGLQPLRDLDSVRSFLSGTGPTALFDLPWLPFYICICFIFHFWIGVVALGGAVVLMILTLLTELRTKGPTGEASEIASMRNAMAEAARRNAEAVQAMGFGERIISRWQSINAQYQDASAQAGDVAGALGTISRVFRLMLQSGILAIGAWLVIKGEATGGIIIAASIMTSRALAPIELAIANWKGFVASRQSWKRLNQLLLAFPGDFTSVDLPPPANTLSVESVAVAVPGERQMIVQDASLALKSGDGLGIIGPSGSGKSSLVRAIAGVWPPARGSIRLDGASLDQWAPGKLGLYVGYLPQDVQLFAGTIAENISRFDPDASSDLILAASRAGGVHDMIVRMPEGYDTQIGGYLDAQRLAA